MNTVISGSKSFMSESIPERKKKDPNRPLGRKSRRTKASTTIGGKIIGAVIELFPDELLFDPLAPILPGKIRVSPLDLLLHHINESSMVTNIACITGADVAYKTLFMEMRERKILVQRTYNHHRVQAIEELAYSMDYDYTLFVSVNRPFIPTMLYSMLVSTIMDGKYDVVSADSFISPWWPSGARAHIMKTDVFRERAKKEINLNTIYGAGAIDNFIAQTRLDLIKESDHARRLNTKVSQFTGFPSDVRDRLVNDLCSLGGYRVGASFNMYESTTIKVFNHPSVRRECGEYPDMLGVVRSGIQTETP